MNRLLLILALACGGCTVYRGGDSPAPAPTSDAIAQAAYDACKAHAAGLAKVASAMADKSGEFKEHSDAVDFGKAENLKEREAAFKAFYKLVDAELDPEHSPYDAAKLENVYRSAARGYERAAK